MEISEAARLIDFQVGNGIQIWADLGCGAGTFTYALASKLPNDSTVYAVDRENQHLRTTYGQVAVEFVQSDFQSGLNSLPLLDGVIMANSLHFIKDKITFFDHLKRKLKREGKLLIVEYETNVGSNWVPFPIRFNELKALANLSGFTQVLKLGEIPSRYQGSMYSALLTI
ncbi:class I SAM-dependent methyltransferase [Marinoscillum pacificum]|uniref:class I SAM-dependent methyltransferase n=1 Tax=Marinoscillum pacificum TaxID=392723 RepID=UPI002157A264|nr:class I SAM-dependent methyltransferase [Marinoscillum pacificum]